MNEEGIAPHASWRWFIVPSRVTQTIKVSCIDSTALELVMIEPRSGYFEATIQLPSDQYGSPCPALVVVTVRFRLAGSWAPNAGVSPPRRRNPLNHRPVQNQHLGVEHNELKHKQYYGMPRSIKQGLLMPSNLGTRYFRSSTMPTIRHSPCSSTWAPERHKSFNCRG